MLIKTVVCACFLTGLQVGGAAQALAQEPAKAAPLQADNSVNGATLASNDGAPQGLPSVENPAVDPVTAGATDYPLAGKLTEFKFGQTLLSLNFKDNKTLSIVGTTGVFKGVVETVNYTAIKIRPMVYMVYWHEPVSKLNVLHIEDFEHNVVYTNVTYPDLKFLHLKGSLRIIGDSK